MSETINIDKSAPSDAQVKISTMKTISNFFDDNNDATSWLLIGFSLSPQEYDNDDWLFNLFSFQTTSVFASVLDDGMDIPSNGPPTRVTITFGHLFLGHV